ncbi:MAG: hypothetical protein AB7V16_06980 [Vulcanibacillus sp.]
MEKILIEYKDLIILTLSFLTLPFIIFIISLASVYLLGRMLNIVMKPNHKNSIAFIVMVISYIFYFHFIKTNFTLYESIWYSVIYCALSIIFYVLFGFKLYDRVDNFLDKKLPDTKEKRKK